MRFSSLLIAFVVSLASGVAHAQDERAAILDTQVGDGAEPGSGEAVGRLIRAELDGLGVVETASGVALDLSEVQLALGCVGETPACLGPVADELSVRYLLIPHLDRSGDERMLTIALFDRQQDAIRRVVRRAPSRPELFDAVEGALRELFDLPAAPVEPDPPPVEEPADPAPEPAPPAGGSLSPWPFVVMGVGAAALGAGIGFGVASTDAQAEWESAGEPTNPGEVDAARDPLDRAESHALAANVLFVVGGLALAGGVAWLLIELLSGSDEAGDTAFAPMVGPHTVGVAAQGRWEAP